VEDASLDVQSHHFLGQLILNLLVAKSGLCRPADFLRRLIEADTVLIDNGNLAGRVSRRNSL
jgi:hypothetical protein